ncbi:MAG: hypothetical protein ABIV51_12690 [Saprospiraceae bacterium]
MRSKFTPFCLLFCLLALNVALIGQKTDFSPYSRFGLGNVSNPNFLATKFMGDLSSAFQDPYQINVVNPASLGTIASSSFDVGMHVGYSAISDATKTQKTWNGNLNYISLAFPVKNQLNQLMERKKSDFNWGTGVSLLPFSTVGYSIKSNDSLADIGKVVRGYQGAGGTYKFLWSNGVRWKQLSAGANVGFLFGKISRSRIVQFQDLIGPYDDVLNDDFNVNGFVWNIGVQYNVVLEKPNKDKVKNKEGRNLIFGATWDANHKVNLTQSTLYQRFSGVYSKYDTIEYVQDLKKKGTLPGSWSLGAVYQYGNQWKIGVDVSGVNWSNYSNDIQRDTLQNTFKIGLGAEWVPNVLSYNNYADRIRYRLGFVYQSDPRHFAGGNPEYYSARFGVGLPLQKSRQISFLNVGVELGYQGGDVPLTETFFKFYLGASLNDNGWFFKRKFQ